MTKEERRYNALSFALALSKEVGLTCPACITDMAAKFDAYLESGTVATAHLSDIPEDGNELAGEVGEACNVMKKLERVRLGIAGSTDTVEHLGEELADVIICVDLIAEVFGIDLWAAVRSKFNATSDKLGLPVHI